MPIKVGDKVQFKIRTVGEKTLECLGIVNGVVKDHGGTKYIITEWSVQGPKIINIRKVELV